MALTQYSSALASDYNDTRTAINSLLVTKERKTATSATVSAGVTSMNATNFNKLLTDYDTAIANWTSGCSTNYGTNNASQCPSNRANNTGDYARYHTNYYRSGSNGTIMQA